MHIFIVAGAVTKEERDLYARKSMGKLGVWENAKKLEARVEAKRDGKRDSRKTIIEVRVSV